MTRFHPLVRKRAIHGALLFIVKRVLTLVLALIVAWAPVLPSFAMTIEAGDAPAVHVSHAGNHADMSDHGAPKQTPCTQHDSCDGQCCAFCAQCFSAVSLMLLDQAHSHPVQISNLTGLHPRLVATSPDRPPRILSL